MSKMEALRKERIGITNAARILGVSVSEIKAAIQTNSHLRGHKLPEPFRVGADKTQYQFTYGDIADVASAIQQERKQS